jgi:hypothetical protein
MIYFVIIFVVAIPVLLLWLMTIKDVYYGFGRAVALIGNGALVEYKKDQSLTFIINEKCTESFIGHLGDAVYKLLLKNGFIKDLE